MPLGEYDIRIVDDQLVQDGIRYAALLNEDERKIIVSARVPITERLRACVILGAQIQQSRQADRIPVYRISDVASRLDGAT